MKYTIALSVMALLLGCASDRVIQVKSSGSHSRRIERELNFYVAAHPSHATNHFYVGATKSDHGQLVEALVYWKEERTLLNYIELEGETPHDVFAWPGHDLKLDRDTVDTRDEIAGSNYLVTHRDWVEWVEQCISKGKLYCVLSTNAVRMFPTRARSRNEND